jgi:hypothetical protein
MKANRGQTASRECRAPVRNCENGETQKCKLSLQFLLKGVEPKLFSKK